MELISNCKYVKCIFQNKLSLTQTLQENRAIARKPRDAVRFSLMFADIHYKLRVAKLQKPSFRALDKQGKKQNLT